MTQDEIIALAKEAGFMQHLGVICIPNIQNLERFASLVAASEREACRRAFDAYLLTSDPGPLRARGNNES